MSLLNEVTNLVTAEDKEAASLEAQRQSLKTTRDKALDAMTYTLADGSVLQTRPKDLANFQTAIAAGVSQKWILADNTVRLTTVVELDEALKSAIAQAKVIWTDYADALEALGA